VRRNRRRFWKSEQGQDKQAAYQTLYTVLTTLAKLFAPIMPFLTEAMYQNLRTSADPESIHLCDFPQDDPTSLYQALSNQMDAILRFVTMGLAARNAAKIKVRQPLAEMVINPAETDEWDAIERYHQLMEDELNIKIVRCINIKENEVLGGPSFRMNPNTTGPKFKNEKQTVSEDLQQVLFKLGESGKIDLLHRSKLVGASEYPLVPGGVEELKGNACGVDLKRPDLFNQLSDEDILVSFNPRIGWTAVEDGERLIIIDCRVSEALKHEGMVRDVIRQVQELRKKANLEMENRIVLHLQTDSEELRRALDEHRPSIESETLAAKWSKEQLQGEGVHRAGVKVDGQPLTIELRKIS